MAGTLDISANIRVINYSDGVRSRVPRFKSKGKPELLELYNLTKDIGEKNNVAALNVEKVAELKSLLARAKTPSESKAFDWSAEEQ